jgi:hypothetical protein
MALVDLSSDLSKFRSEVSREPKSTPESSKATNNKNFATFQPITEKLSQFSMNVKRQEPKKLESKLESTNLDDIKKVVSQNLIINRVSRLSNINQDYDGQNRAAIPTAMVSERLGQVQITEFSSRLTKSDIIPIKQSQGTNNNISGINVETQSQGIYNNISPVEVTNDKDEQSNNIVNPDVDIIVPVQSFDRTATSPDIKPNLTDSSDNITDPKIEITRPPQSFDREEQSIEISKDLVSPINNITDPKTVLDLNVLTYERAKQSPPIVTDRRQDGFVTDPKTGVFRFDGATIQTDDNSRLNIDGLPIRFIPISQLEKFELPREVDIARYDLESIQTEDNSNLNVDAVIKTNPSGRHEDPSVSGLSIIGTQSVNFFTDTKAKGFVVRQQGGETLYTGQSVFGWSGKRESAPTTNFISDTNGKGFTKFAQIGQTLYETESSVFGFTTIQSTDFFDVTKKYSSDGFKLFATLYESDYKKDSSQFTFNGAADSAPVVNYFDLNGKVTSDGFHKFAQIYDTKYVPDSSLFTWTGNRDGAPESNFFDVNSTSTTSGFHKFAQIYDTKYILDSSIYDWDGTREDSPEVNYFDISGKNTKFGFHRFAQIYDTKYIPNSSIYDWDGTSENAPEVNYFDIIGKNTSQGFHKFAQLYQTKYVHESSDLDWNGVRTDAPEVNYFDITGRNTNAGFHRLAQLYDTKYIHESSDFDWNGVRTDAPEVNYFDLTGQHTTSGFHKLAQIYDTKYVHESSLFDWNGVRTDAPEVNYFDLGGRNTTIGFHRLAQLYDTKYIHESSLFDWNGVRTDAPEVNFFDLNKQHQTVGFHRLAQKYDTKFIKDSSLFDFDGGSSNAPEVNFFDLNGQFTSKGFEKFPQALVTRYIKDSSRFDFDGNSKSAPETDFFDLSKKFTSKGFEKFPQLLVTKYIKDSSQFDFDGTSKSAPTTDFFPNTNAKGFTSFPQKLQTEYVKDSSEFTFKGSLPSAVNFFPDDNQSGFINKTPLLETKYEKDSSRFTFKGTLPEPVDFFPNTSAPGFEIKTAPLETKYIQDVSRFTFKGTRADAPNVNYFPDDFNSGFTTLAQPLSTEYQSDISRFTFKGTRQDAPSVDYLQNNPASGFEILTQPLQSKYKKEVSRFTWVGTRQDSPEVDFLKIPNGNPNSINGFTRLFADVTDTKLSDSFSRFSIESANSFSSVKKVPYTKFFGFLPIERSGFLVGMTNVNSSLYPLFNPKLTPDDPAGTRFSIEGQRSQNRRQMTDNVAKYAPKTLGGLFWSDGINTGTATLDNQVPYIKTKEPDSFGSTYFRKYEKLAKDSTESLGYLTKWAITRRSPSPLDAQYNKYKLQAESTNYGSPNSLQPYVVRGIQRDGEVENQRWGFGVNFDDGFVRGGVVTQVERIFEDLKRIGQWSLSTKGLMFNIRQLALQVMNPVTDVDPDNKFTSGIIGLPYPSTMLYNPFSLVANIATARIGLHLPRHGILPFSNIFLNKYETATKNRELKLDTSNPEYKSWENVSKPSSSNRDPDGKSRLIGLMKELLPNSFSPIVSSTRTQIPSLPSEAQQAIDTARGLDSSSPDAAKYAEDKAKQIQTDVNNGKEAYKNPGQGSTNASGFGESSTINRLTTSFGGPNSFLGIGGTTFNRAGHPYLTYYTTNPDLYDSKHPSYNDFMKRDTYFAATKTYGDVLLSNSTIRALYYLLGGDANKPADIPTLDSVDVPVQKGVKDILKASLSLSAEYPLENTRLFATTKYDQAISTKKKISQGPQVDPEGIPGAIRRYRTSNYDQLKRNDRRRSSKFNDFRGSITLDEKTKAFVTNPDIARFDTRNLTDRYGFGDQGEPGAQRDLPYLSTIQYSRFAKEGIFNSGESEFKDYAVSSEKIIDGQKQKFRGDRINIIDYKRANFNINTNLVYEKGEYTDQLPGADDLIEFYFSSLVLSGHKNCPAEVIVFRASFNSITDNHNPSWNSVKYMGRADPLYVYQGYEREISFGFTVHIGSRDEMKASWRKLNYLASWTAPEYIRSGLIRGPMIRLNIGHLYRKMPGYISSLSYTFDNSQTTWETAKLPEDMALADPTVSKRVKPGVLQLPKHVDVSISFVPVGVYRPEFRGIMYSLYDDRVSGNNVETGLQPLTSKKVNYFNEFDDTDEPVIYSGVDVDKKGSLAERDYGAAANANRAIDSEPIFSSEVVPEPDTSGLQEFNEQQRAQQDAEQMERVRSEAGDFSDISGLG